jgi:hypothetical protein
MKKIYLKSIVFGLATVALASCSDVADEITSIVYNRNFSPTSVEAKVRNRTNIELSWNLGDGVTNYNVEVYANDSLTFAGSPVQSLSVTPDQVPVLITGLDGETQYSFRVQATDGDATRDSKWAGAYAKTEAEQLFKNVKEEDIKAKEVTLRWTAGEEAATITLTPGNIVYNITAADIAAGAATVTGLTPETEYTAVMARANGKTRGKISFKTGVFLEETDILVKAGSDIAAAIKDAPEGYRLVVEPGEYGIATDAAAFGGSVTISKQLTIKGLRQNDHPVIKGRFKVEAPFAVDQVTLDGTGTDGGQCFDFTKDGNIESFSISNSEISNFVKGMLYINKKVAINTITIDRCLITNIECDGGDFIDSRAGGWNTLTMTNSTVFNSVVGRAVVRFDNNSNVSVSAITKIENCTFALTGTGNKNSYGFLHIRYKGNSSVFKNNIVADFDQQRGFSDQASTTPAEFDNNFYFNTKNLLSKDAASTKTPAFFDTTGTNLQANPFADEAKGDLTIINDDVKDKKAGDPRWF